MRPLIKLEENKQVFFVNEIYNDTDPTHVYIPIDINKQVSYKTRDYIYKNTLIENTLVHTPISGYVTGVKKVKLREKFGLALEITNDFKENPCKRILSKRIKTKEDLLASLKDKQLLELYNKINQTTFQNLVLLSLDEEVYSMKEFMITSKFNNELLESASLLMDLLAIKRGYVAIKNTSSSVIKRVRSIMGTYLNMKLVLLPDKYLLGRMDFLCSYLNIKGEETLVLKASEMYDIYEAIIKNHFILDTFVTISGDAIKKSLVLKVKIGTSLKELVDKYIEIIKDYELYLNGYLEGEKIHNIEDVIITKDIHTVIFKEKQKVIEEKCIKCGACSRICPMKINVYNCYVNNLRHQKCIGCGLCNYICPSHIHLKEIVEVKNKNES